MKTLLLIWNNKQKITGAVTGIVSMVAAAGMIPAQMALWITTLTGAIMIVFALIVDIQSNKPDA
jgi:ammonia channel protein AmtB